MAELIAETANGQSWSVIRIDEQPLSVPSCIEDYRVVLANDYATGITFEGRAISLVAGQVLAVSSYELLEVTDATSLTVITFHHDFYCMRAGRHEVYCDGVVFNRLVDLPVVTLPGSESARLVDRIDELATVIASASSLRKERAVACLRGILLQIADTKLSLLEARADQIGLSDLVLRFQDLVQENFLVERKAEFYADALGLSAKHLNRKLTDEIGTTVQQAINERVAIEARIRLRGTNKTITSVSDELGFEDPLYFSRFFKRYHGVSPSNFFRNPASAALA